MSSKVTEEGCSVRIKRTQMIISAVGVIFASVLLAVSVPKASANGEIAINDCVELQKVGYDDGYPLDGSYKLAGDINCAASGEWNEGTGFNPIGPDYENRFTGTFDGRGYTISNLAIIKPTVRYVGLFGRTGEAAIKNLNLRNVYVMGQDTVGGLAGEVANTDVERVSVVNTNGTAKIIASGEDKEGDPTNAWVGGLIGVFHNSTLTNAYARTPILSYYEGWAHIAGGLIGSTSGSSGDITNVYAASYITGTFTSSGPLFGSLYYDTNTSSTFWDSDVYSSGDGSGEDNFGNSGNGRSTTWLKTQGNLVDASWNFDSVWEYGEGNDGYPTLRMPTQTSVNASNDKNGDGIIDALQPNVSTLASSVTGKDVVLVVDDACEVDEATMKAQGSFAAQDQDFTYPEGFMDFTATCGTPGFTSTVTQYYYDVSLETFSLRKFNPHTSQYLGVSNASITQQTIYGQPVLAVTYQVTDGGELDVDNQENGVIVDPVGLAQAITNSSGLANTGQAALLPLLGAFATIVVSSSLYAWRRHLLAARANF